MSKFILLTKSVKLGLNLCRFAFCIMLNIVSFFAGTSNAAAETYKYQSTTHMLPTAIDACIHFSYTNGWNFYKLSNHFVVPQTGNGPKQYKCYFDIMDNSGGITRIGPYPIARWGDSCETDKALDIEAGECIASCSSVDKVLNVSTGVCGHDEEKGKPPQNSCVGNPINIAMGNKFQFEIDYASSRKDGLSFSRYYNSMDQAWRHNYSASLRFTSNSVSLVHPDGRETFFSISENIAKPLTYDSGSLVRIGEKWIYTAQNSESFTFDSDGRLVEWKNSSGSKQYLSYNNFQIQVKNDIGETLVFAEDVRHQPLYLSAPGIEISYTYGASNTLVSLSRTRSNHTEERKFHYEDPLRGGLLTGITDERGVRFATWTYDDKGRAISSQHSGAAGLTLVAYNADGSSTVTNELGKTTVYRYQQIGGVKRVTLIEGEPSPNCPASNSSYTYNDRGQVLTKTDAKGLVTAYTYNDRGLETSRIEASGTPLARTVTTEWDASRFLPVRIVEPERTTVYSYDAQGRELSRHTTSR